MKKEDKFIQGYVCAVCNIINSHGHNTHTKEAFKGIGYQTEKSLRLAGVDLSDIDTLKRNGLI